MCRYQQKRLDYAANYIRGELTEIEAEAFEAHYLTCEECFSAISFVQKAAVTMNHFGASIFAPAPAKPRPAFLSLGWLEKGKTWCNDFVFSTDWKTAAPSLATYVLLVAVLSAGYYWFFNNQRIAYHKLPAHVDKPSAMLPESIKIADLPKLQPLPWQISESAKANTVLYARLNEVQPLYENYNFFLADTSLTEIVNDFPESSDANLYLGISQLRLIQPAEAIASFHKVLELNPEHADAQWYLAQGYLMESNVAEAQSWLTALADKKNPQYGQSAIQLLKEIDKMQPKHK